MTPLPAFMTTQYPRQIARQIAQIRRLDPAAYAQIEFNTRMGAANAALDLLAQAQNRALARLNTAGGRELESTWLKITRLVESGQMPATEFDQKPVAAGLVLYLRRDGRVVLYNQHSGRASAPVADHLGVNAGLISSPTARAWRLTSNARAAFDDFMTGQEVARKATSHRAYVK
jgi:hypothetical protein